MALPHTKAASIMQQNIDTISPHQVISLLMDGALERIEQAIMAVHGNSPDDYALLETKLVAILNGLRNSLDFERGGDIATNLNELYLYMTSRIAEAPAPQKVMALTEVRQLLIEIKLGWDNMPAPAVLAEAC